MSFCGRVKTRPYRIACRIVRRGGACPSFDKYPVVLTYPKIKQRLTETVSRCFVIRNIQL